MKILMGLFLMLLTAPTFAGTVMLILNQDGPNEGLNDPASASPIGGNQGTTLGEQRLNAIQHAADIIGQTIHSDIPIEISVNFDNLGGSASAGRAASGGPAGVFESFSGAPIPATWYPAALANKLGDQDFSPSAPEIQLTINSSIDGPITFGDSVWYYGLDASPSNDDIDLVTVALHEIIHGLGFLSLLQQNSGEKFLGLDDIYTNFLNHSDPNPYGLAEMTNLQRATALVSNNLTWRGTSISDANLLFTDISEGIEDNLISLYAPYPIEFGSSTSHFDPSIAPNTLMEPSYDEANHSLGLAKAVLSDIGWGRLTDLSIELLNPETVTMVGTEVEKRYLITNRGTQSAASTRLTYQYHRGVTELIDFGITQGSCEVVRPEAAEEDLIERLQCQLGEVQPQQLVTLTLSQRFNEIGEINQTLKLNADIVEANPVDNQVALRKNLVSASDFEIINNQPAQEESEAVAGLSAQEGASDLTDAAASPTSETVETNPSSGGGSLDLIAWFTALFLALLRAATARFGALTPASASRLVR